MTYSLDLNIAAEGVLGRPSGSDKAHYYTLHDQIGVGKTDSTLGSMGYSAAQKRLRVLRLRHLRATKELVFGGSGMSPLSSKGYYAYDEQKVKHFSPGQDFGWRRCQPRVAREFRRGLSVCRRRGPSLFPCRDAGVQVFKPIQNDIDLCRGTFLLDGFDHQKSLPVWTDVVVWLKGKYKRATFIRPFE